MRVDPPPQCQTVQENVFEELHLPPDVSSEVQTAGTGPVSGGFGAIVDGTKADPRTQKFGTIRKRSGNLHSSAETRLRVPHKP